MTNHETMYFSTSNETILASSNSNEGTECLGSICRYKIYFKAGSIDLYVRKKRGGGIADLICIIAVIGLSPWSLRPLLRLLLACDRSWPQDIL